MESIQNGTLGSQPYRSRIQDFVISEVRHPASFHAEPHSHRFATLKLVLKGPYAESTRGQSAVHAPLTVLTKPAGEVHANAPFPEATHSLLLEMTTDQHDIPWQGTDLFAAPSEMNAGIAAAAGMRLAIELRRHRDSTTTLALEEGVVELLSALSRSPLQLERRPSWVRRVIEWIEDDPGGRVQLAELAAEVDRERHYVSRGFRKATGMTISGFARHVRLTRAARKLTETRSPISEIAYETGFSDQAHLTNCLKRSTGVTPGQHRAMARQLGLPLRASPWKGS